MEKFNVVIIGGGSAGLMVAAGAVGLGARAALVEARKMGGDCLNFGCVPSKTLISAANLAAAMARGGQGIGAGRPDFSWGSVAGRVQSAIDAIAPHDSVERFEGLGVEVFLGRGKLLSPTRVEVTLQDGSSRTLDSRSIVIATGSSPAVPPIPGLEESGYLTNETVFTMGAQPRRLLVLGGGPIGSELAQSFARLGSRVTLVELLPRILPREDADAAGEVAQVLREDGVELLTETRVIRVEREGGVKRVLLQAATGSNGASEAGRSVEVDEILVATGRRLNLAGLGLEEAGVEYDGTGVRVNRRLATTARSVFACGDVLGEHLFTHMANQQARVVIQNALLPFKARMDYRVVPWCTFTDPELARVGLSEGEAEARGIAYRAIRIPFAGIDRAVCEGNTRGFLKVLTPPGRDVILGATLVGAHAGDLIHEIVLAMEARIGLNGLARMIHIYPTRAEIFRRAGDEARKAGFTPRLQRLFKAYLRWQRR